MLWISFSCVSIGELRYPLRGGGIEVEVGGSHVMRRVLTCESRDLHLWSHGVVWHTKEPDSCWSPQADSIAIVRDCLVVKILIM